MKIILVAILFFSISGCNGTLVQLQEPTFDQGCYTSNVGAKLGVFNQEGSGEMYKVKCSKELPENYCYKITNQNAGLEAKVGNCD